MLQGVTILLIAVALICAFVLYLATERMIATRGGRIGLALGVACLPLLATAGSAGQAVNESSSTEFCMECHEMSEHGKSLFIDDPRALPAVHYQKRLIERDKTCYECHTDYAMFGDLKAKTNGLLHVYVHFLGEVPAPEDMELYQPYPNYNCLHCHADARGYVEAAPHEGKFEALAAEEESCLKCHGKGHALDQLEEGEFWLGP